MKKIKIAIVDDHAIFRDGLKLVLNQIDDLEVVAEFSSGDKLLSKLDGLTAEIVLMDINMPGTNGIRTTEALKSQRADIQIIGLTMQSDESTALRMIESGADGLVLKKAGQEELNTAVHTVIGGGNYFSQEVLQKLAFRINKKNPDPVSNLTNREKEVLYEICNGLETKEISAKLFISPKTVEVHRAKILSKTKCRNVAQLIIWALKNGVYSI